jgi:cytochrome bd-type quinol oxidase subunit 2
MTLVASRFALIELESKETAREWAKRATLIAAACVCAVFAWALLLAGGVSLIAEASGWPWYWVAIGAAILHLLAGAILVSRAKSSPSPTFPVTRAEFQKDREWIENFHKTKKSND